MKILVINGPNLNLLGTREPETYGNFTLADIEKSLKEITTSKGAEIDFFQSNSEGLIIDVIHNAAIKNYDGIILNAGAYTHTSIAIRDAILGSNIPVIEVHISNIYKREEFRHNSFISDVAMGQICGLGKDVYVLALIKFLGTENFK